MYRPVGQAKNSTATRSRRDSATKAVGFKKLAKWKKLIFIGFIIYLLFIGKGLYNQEQTIVVNQQEVAELEQEYQEIKANNETLEGRFNRLHDEEYIAEIARQNYYLAKPGEVLFIIPQGR